MSEASERERELSACEYHGIYAHDDRVNYDDVILNRGGSQSMQTERGLAIASTGSRYSEHSKGIFVRLVKWTKG